MKYDFSELNNYLLTLNLSSSIVSNVSHSLKQINNSNDDFSYLIENLHEFYLKGFLGGLNFADVISNDEHDNIINLLNSSMSKNSD